MQDLPAVTKVVRKLQDEKPPSARPVSGQADLPGNLLWDYATVVAVNNTGSQSGNLAPYTCSLSYQNTTVYGVAWINLPVAGHPAIVLVQQPFMIVLGTPSNA